MSTSPSAALRAVLTAFDATGSPTDQAARKYLEAACEVLENGGTYSQAIAEVHRLAALDADDVRPRLYLVGDDEPTTSRGTATT